MKIGDAFPSRWLKATDIPSGQMVAVTMEHIEVEDVAGDNSEQKPVLYFVGKTKGLVLNKTNAETIALAFGDDTDNWAGHTIKLFQTPVTYQGQTKPGIRVAASAARPSGGVGMPTPPRPAPKPVTSPVSDEPQFAPEDIQF